MKKPIVDEWTGCYPSNWKGLIVPDAIKHPAKFSSKLIARIYDHMVAQGWLHAGDVVLDPFAGVSLGAFDAMRLGLRWRGIELEANFADLGNQNIALWNHRFSRMPHWCEDAMCFHGDSRKLLAILQEAEGAVSSPPYAETPIISFSEQEEITKDVKRQLAEKGFIEFDGQRYTENEWRAMNHGRIDGRTTRGTGKGKTGYSAAGAVSSPPYAEARIGQESGQEQCGRGDQYGATDGQLGAMKNDGFDAALSSPPYGGMPIEKNSKSIDREKQYAVYRASGGGQSFEAFCKTQEMHSEGYGNSNGQLSHMPTGGLDAALSSPPYNKPFSQDHPGTRGGKRGTTPSEAGAFVRYGNTDGQLEGLPDGDFEAAVSSPPFMQASGGTNTDVRLGRGDPDLIRRHAAGNAAAHAYGDSEGQLSSMKDDGFDGAVTSPPYEASFNGQHDARSREDREAAAGHKLGGGQIDHARDYGNTDGQLGIEAGDSFWLSARAIVDQVYAALCPGAHAVWVVKGFVKNHHVVDFPGQWQQLCEAAGLETVHIHHAMLTNKRGASYTLDGGTVEHKTEAKSFFRRNGENKARAKKWWDTCDLSRDCKAEYLWKAKREKWVQWITEVLKHQEDGRVIKKPKAFIVRGLAQMMAYRDAGEPEIEIETSIDYETVLCMRKPEGI